MKVLKLLAHGLNQPWILLEQALSCCVATWMYVLSARAQATSESIRICPTSDFIFTKNEIRGGQITGRWQMFSLPDRRLKGC